MNKFQGFTDQETFTRVPDAFFRQLLNDIQEADELKVTLYVLWRMEHMEGRFRALLRSEIVADGQFLDGLGEAGVDAGLEKAVQRGSLLTVKSEEGALYFLNSPRGRAAAEAAQKGTLPAAGRSTALAPLEHPNIFKLYEANIGPLTPILADALRDAEKTYPAGWIEEALGEAVKRNKRSWKYVEAILRRWKEEGHGEEQDRRNTEEDRRKYIEGKYGGYVKH